LRRVFPKIGFKMPPPWNQGFLDTPEKGNFGHGIISPEDMANPIGV